MAHAARHSQIENRLFPKQPFIPLRFVMNLQISHCPTHRTLTAKSLQCLPLDRLPPIASIIHRPVCCCVSALKQPNDRLFGQALREGKGQVVWPHWWGCDGCHMRFFMKPHRFFTLLSVLSVVYLCGT